MHLSHAFSCTYLSLTVPKFAGKYDNKFISYINSASEASRVYGRKITQKQREGKRNSYILNNKIHCKTGFMGSRFETRKKCESRKVGISVHDNLKIVYAGGEDGIPMNRDLGEQQPRDCHVVPTGRDSSQLSILLRGYHVCGKVVASSKGGIHNIHGRRTSETVAKTEKAINGFGPRAWPAAC